MTDDVRVLAASCLTPAGYGSSTLGWRPWLDSEGKPCEREDLMGLSWSSMFPVPCSRFGRMSPLARLGLMAVELLDVRFAEMTEAQRTDTGFCLLSPSGSMTTDIEFLRELSPATFTYTLPSSVIGEVCIRHRLRGPGLCLMSEATAGRGIVEEAAERLTMGEAETMLCLLCDVRKGEQDIPKYVLDQDSEFCWYAYGLFLVRGDGFQGAGTALVQEAAGSDIRRICIELCRRGA